MIKYKYNGNEYDWLSGVRKAIWEDERVAFGAFTEEVISQFGIVKVNLPDPEPTPYIPTEEELAKQVREERDRKIQETDYYLMPDYPAEPEQLKLVKAYRQALRDITKQATFPQKVTWPEEPAILAREG